MGETRLELISLLLIAAKLPRQTCNNFNRDIRFMYCRKNEISGPQSAENAQIVVKYTPKLHSAEHAKTAENATD